MVRIFKDRDIEILGKSVCEVLENVGIICQNEEILKALEDKGAEVDYSQGTAKFPKKMVMEFVEIFRKERVSNENLEKFIPPPLPTLNIQVAQFFYDYEKNEKRRGNKDDFIYLIKLGTSLHKEDGVGHCLLLTEVHPLIEPLEAGRLLIEYAHKPHPPFAWKVEQIDYLIEIGEIVGFKNWFSWGAICFAHPFRFDKDVADKFVRRVKEGYPTGLSSMAIAGVTSPVTVEGYVVVASAEHIATWIAAKSINPEVKLKGAMYGGSIDMKTGEVSYSSFDALFYSFATVEFLKKWCGISIPVGGGEYCDAKLPGLYAALEKAYKAMIIYAFTGYHPSVGQGMLEEGKILCPVQLLLERELGIGLRHLGKEIEVNKENIGIENIFDVGFGLKTSYLVSEHTLRNFRSSLWCPKIWDRSGWNGFEYEIKLLKKAQKEVNDLVSEYKKPEIDPDKISKIKKVIEKAKKNLLKL